MCTGFQHLGKPVPFHWDAFYSIVLIELEPIQHNNISLKLQQPQPKQHDFTIFETQLIVKKR